ncbi:MAG: hypothetical protein ABI863_19580 [Ginsengibacter sp.]
MDQSAKGTSASIRIAQISLLLLQSVAHDSYKDEYRIALMLSRSNSFKWIRTFLSDESSEGFMTEIAYAGSRVTLFVKVFENSLNEPNPLWSLIWRALRLAKQMIVAIAQAFDNADLLKKTPGSVEQITTYVLNRSASVIRLYCESLIEKGKMDSFEDKRTLALLQCATELYELIDLFKKENFASDIFKQSLKNTIEKLDFGDPFSDFNILLR